jgi:hypothetical protein
MTPLKRCAGWWGSVTPAGRASREHGGQLLRGVPWLGERKNPAPVTAPLAKAGRLRGPVPAGRHAAKQFMARAVMYRPAARKSDNSMVLQAYQAIWSKAWSFAGTG